MDEIGTSFGIPEMGQFSLDGEIRRSYWQESKALAGWASDYGVTVTDAVIAGV